MLNWVKWIEESCKHDISLLNAMIIWYAKIYFPKQALELYKQMELEGVKWNRFTFPLYKNARVQLEFAIRIEIHGHIVGIWFISNVFMVNSLITMYTKCGCVKDAQQVFDEMLEHNLVSWNSMIVRYSQNGHANEVLMLFREMQLQGVEKYSITIVVFSQLACNWKPSSG